MPPAIRHGAFILTNFPFGPPNRPDQPGPVPHIAYCLAVQTTRKGRELILAYTSSGPWRPPGQTVPIGVIEFDRTAAQALHQKPFHLDLRVLARVPPTPAWLPHLDEPNAGVIACADQTLRARINAAAEQLALRRPEVIQIRGTQSPPRR
ncbi:MAG: hypothetical protein QOD93_3114 [Acetobacteraceae bacterium]|nr:hypothetical protein [Rhodopila sp.]MEA2727822.1 hypothetical protein [Acetobacteraceae bacterium]MEA2770152.1 hypothetical protein [Acetobacteraceae bacterium]